MVRLLGDDEARSIFGADRPTSADFDRFLTIDWWTERCEDSATVLYRDGESHGPAFWGG